MAEEVAGTKRMEKVERLKIAWKKRMAIREYEQMLRKLAELTVMELNGDMVDIEAMIKNMMVVESEEKKVCHYEHGGRRHGGPCTDWFRYRAHQVDG